MCISSCIKKLLKFTQKIKKVDEEGNGTARARVRNTFLLASL